MTLENWQTYPEYLLKLFKAARISPGWDLIRVLHDEEDNRHFDLLERHYQSGKLNVTPYG